MRGKACAAEGLDAAEGGAGRPCVTPLFPAGTSRLEWPIRAEGDLRPSGRRGGRRHGGRRCQGPRGRRLELTRIRGRRKRRARGIVRWAQLVHALAGQARQTRERVRGPGPAFRGWNGRPSERLLTDGEERRGEGAPNDQEALNAWGVRTIMARDEAAMDRVDSTRRAGWELGHDVCPRGVRRTGRDDELALTLGEREGGEDRPQSGRRPPNSPWEGRSVTRRRKRPRSTA